MMLVLVPTGEHHDRSGEIVDYCSWRRRGWCRLEFMAAKLSRNDMRIMVAKGSPLMDSNIPFPTTATATATHTHTHVLLYRGYRPLSVLCVCVCVCVCVCCVTDTTHPDFRIRSRF